MKKTQTKIEAAVAYIEKHKLPLIFLGTLYILMVTALAMAQTKEISIVIDHSQGRPKTQVIVE